MPSITLRSISPDVVKYILKVQSEIKSKKKIRQYSRELTLVQIIKEHRDLKEKALN